MEKIYNLSFKQNDIEITSAVKSIPIKFIVIASEPGSIKWWELISWLYQKWILEEIKGFFELVWNDLAYQILLSLKGFRDNKVTYSKLRKQENLLGWWKCYRLTFMHLSELIEEYTWICVFYFVKTTPKLTNKTKTP